MNALHDKTYVQRQEHFGLYVFVANLAGTVLLGGIASVAAGALTNAPTIFSRSFFVAVGVSACVLAWCRFSSENAALDIHLDLGDGIINPSDTLKPADIPFAPRTNLHIELCMVSVSIPFCILLAGIWIPFLHPYNFIVYGSIIGAIAFPFLAYLFALCKSHCSQPSQSDDPTLDERQSSGPQTSQHSPPSSELTYARLLSIYDLYSLRAKVAGIALLAQVASIAAGAFADAPALVHAAFFTSILVSASAFAIFRMACELATFGIRRDLADGLMQPSNIVQLQHLSPGVVFAKSVPHFMFIPPFLLLTGIISAPLQLSPVKVAGVVTFFLGLLVFALLHVWKKSRNYQ